MLRNNIRKLCKNVYPHISCGFKLIPKYETSCIYLNSKNFSTNLQPKVQFDLNHEEIDRTKLNSSFSSQPSDNVLKNLDKIFYKVDMDVKKTGRIKKYELQSIINEIKSQKTMTSVQALLLIRCCGNLLVEEPLSERRLLTEQAWNLINQIGIPLDISHYNSLLKVYLENQDFEKISDPAKFLDIIKQKSNTTNEPMSRNFSEPNRVTYQRILAIHCELGDMGQAAKLLEFMKEQDMAINEAVFCSLMRGYAKAGDMSSAKDIMNIMRQSKLEPTSLSYVTLATLLAQEGSLKEMNDVLRDGEKNGINFMNKDLVDVIYALVQSQKSQISQDSNKGQIVKEWLSHFIPYLKPHHDFIKNVINLSARLIATGGVDVEAYEIFKYLTLTAGDEFPEFGGLNNPLTNSGMFIVRQLCTQNVPPHSFQDLAYVCRDMHGTGSNTFAAQKALELAYIYKAGDTKRALVCLDLIKTLALPLRPHYFWPLMARLNHQPNSKQAASTPPPATQMWDLLQTMKSKFDISPNFETLVNYVYPVVDQERPHARVGKVRGSQLTTENLEEAMDEDYEEGGPETGSPSAPRSPTNNLKHTLSHMSSFTTEPLALNSYLYYKIYLAPPLAPTLTPLQNAHTILRPVCTSTDPRVSALVKHIDPRLVNYRLSSLFTASAKEEIHPDSATTPGSSSAVAMLCDILSWTRPSSDSKTPLARETLPLDDVENVIIETELDRQIDLSSYDWNGKILTDLCHASGPQAMEPLIKAFAERHLPISETAFSTLSPSLKSAPWFTPDTETSLKSLIKPGLHMALPLDPVKTSFMMDSSPFRRARTDGPTTPLYRDVQVDELERMLTRYESTGVNALALKRHLLTRYCRSPTPDAKRIEELKQSLAKDYPSSGFNPVTYSSLIEYYIKTGDGARAVEIKRQAEAFDPLFRTSISKIFDMCALLIQARDDVSPSSSNWSERVLSLLDDAAIMPSPPAYDPAPTGGEPNVIGFEEGGRTTAGSPHPVFQHRSNTEFLAWKMLSAAAAAPSPNPVFPLIFEKTLQLLETVLPPPRTQGSKYRASPSILGTLVSYHINNNNVPEAVAVFEKYANQYHVTPNMASLLRALIDVNDTENLQKVVDLSSGIHTEINVLIDLLFVFIEMGRMKEANKIIETPGFWYKPLRFQHYCNKYVRERKVKELEYLINATKNIRDVDRDQMCYFLLQVHEKNNDWQSALNLWTCLQEDNVQPSYQTLQLLAELLQRNGQAVPFIMAESSHNTEPSKDHGKQPSANPKGRQQPSLPNLDPFATLGPIDADKERQIMQLLASDQVEKALELKNELTAGGNVLSGRVYNALLEKMIPKDGMTEKAMDLAREMVSNKLKVPLPTLKSFLSRLSFLGMADPIRDQIPALVQFPATLERLNIEKFISYAYTNAGKASDYLKKYEDYVKETDGQKDSLRLPHGVLYMLNKSPDLYDRVKKLASDYAAVGSHLLQNALFTHHTLKGDYDVAKDIYTNTLEPAIKAATSVIPAEGSPNPGSAEFRHLNVGIICKDAKLKNDEKALRFLIDDIKPENKFLLGLVYSFLISIKCHNAKYDEALEVFNEAQNKDKLDTTAFKIFALRELKNSLESIGKPVPFQMPQQVEQSHFA